MATHQRPQLQTGGNGLENKLTARHIDCHNKKMKVSLAVQTISAYVATALQTSGMISHKWDC